MRKLVLLIFLAGLIFAKEANIFYLGKTYNFAEEDLLIAIKKYIEDNKEYLESKLNKMRDTAKNRIKNYKPEGIKPLTPAKKNRVYYPDLTYTLDRDITDAEGKIIYPKGFTFNPLKYAHLSYGIVVINGKNPTEVEWFKTSKYANTIAYRLLITDGNYYKLTKELNQNVYYCMPQIEERFQLKHTPSIIIQKGDKMEVREICIGCDKEN